MAGPEDERDLNYYIRKHSAESAAVNRWITQGRYRQFLMTGGDGETVTTARHRADGTWRIETWYNGRVREYEVIFSAVDSVTVVGMRYIGIVELPRGAGMGEED